MMLQFFRALDKRTRTAVHTRAGTRKDMRPCQDVGMYVHDTHIITCLVLYHDVCLVNRDRE